MLKRLSSVAMKVYAWFWPNSASNPEAEDIVERAYPYFNNIWSDKRAESWYLEALAVRPDFQGKHIGRKLVERGLELAEGERVCASVVSAWGKEQFYVKCGFAERHGSARDGDGNPLADIEGADIFWRWPKAKALP
jgi:GNAT superfamily N-acetyltransferase